MPDSQSIVVQATNKPRPTNTPTASIPSGCAAAMDELRAPMPHQRFEISPDGKLVSFAAARDDGPSPHDLWLIGSAGGVARNLTGAASIAPVGNYHWAQKMVR